MRGTRPTPEVPVMPTAPDEDGEDRKRPLRSDGGTRAALDEELSEAPLVPDLS